MLRQNLDELIRFVNRSSGRLPGEAVVTARRVTDVLRAVIDSSEVRELDIYTVVSVRGVVDDYLPTTLKSFLALDPAHHDVARARGQTPVEALQEQLELMWESTSAVLVAAQAQDVDALMTQGSFMRTKFSRSDLDL
ncbi:hypothetical protein [Catellatospora methionotrophica]|uniref:hypothetical protein n=1 Tax=Catellatospora methionotrophica TaxID=121620 RepID=UPI00140E04FE|nr:hypothetical protein [Catellatospora methionotrophica]